jgi:mycothiol synthase
MQNSILERAYLHQDQDALIELWLAHRIASSVEVYPTIWRSRLLLSSRVWDPEHDTHIWQAQSGNLLAFAMLWRRSPTSPYIILDYCIQPEAVTNELFQAILNWGVQRTQSTANHQKVSLSLFAKELRNLETPPIFDTRGFKPYQAENQDHNVYFVQNLETKVTAPELPIGYEIMQPQSRDELDAYNSLYNFTSVDHQHLEEQLTSEEYNHFVIINPEGQFAAYCETSICQAEWRRCDLHIGWIDYIGTRPEDQHKGLGFALLLHGLQKLQKQGAAKAMLVTISSNLPAINLYQKAGFQQKEIRETISYHITLQPK